MTFKLKPLAATLAAAATAVAAVVASAPAAAIPLVGLTSDNRLVSFDSATPGTTSASVNITGLQNAADRLVGIDLRSANNTLYGVSTSGGLYSLSLATGVATRVGNLGVTISAGLGYGVDTNPVADALRVISTNGDNYAVSFATGVATVQTSIATGFSGAAYTPAVGGATSLYYLNSTSDSISVATANFGNPTITAVGPLGVDALRANGFEIAADGTAYAALNVDGSSLITGIYSINLGTGAATQIGEYRDTLSGLTIAPVPEPSTYVLMALGLVGIGAIARRRSRD